ncbi:MAG: lysophospholipid acyltransferase family protein [Candidatus Buchananbacteria bacterium]|nr:lysophospholipid acyltransferase family protein [Candidatus Buchananbacteria bacterium]
MIYSKFRAVASYVILFLTGVVFWCFCHILNRTIIIGKKNIPWQKNCLIVANHLTVIDSWFLALAIYWPKAMIRPSLIPWHLPEEGNFMKKNWFLTLLCDLSKCIPINRGSGDFIEKFDLLIDKLQDGSMMIFPEGGRSRQPKSGKLNTWRRGAIVLAYHAQGIVLPVAIRGVEDILPIGSRFPKLFKRVVIVIGQPIKIKDLSNESRSESIKLISEQVRIKLQEVLSQASEGLKK